MNQRFLRFTIAAVGMALLGGCSICENEIGQSVPSPSGKLRAVVFHRECGATVGLNTQVAIISAGSALPDDGGNVAVVDGKASAQVQWSGDANLRVKDLGGGRVFKKESQVGDVAVQYVP